jgi:hypothetical protein
MLVILWTNTRAIYRSMGENTLFYHPWWPVHHRLYQRTTELWSMANTTVLMLEGSFVTLFRRGHRWPLLWHPLIVLIIIHVHHILSYMFRILQHSLFHGFQPKSCIHAPHSHDAHSKPTHSHPCWTSLRNTSKAIKTFLKCYRLCRFLKPTYIKMVRFPT